MWRIIALFAKSLSDLRQSVAQDHADAIIELNKLCSFVGEKQEERQHQIALYQKNSPVIAFFIGDRSEKSGKQLFLRILSHIENVPRLVTFGKPIKKSCNTGKTPIRWQINILTAHLEQWKCSLR